MINGLSLFENNTNELCIIWNSIIDIIILTQDEGETKKDNVIKFCKNVNINLISINYWENLKEFHKIDKEK